MELRAHKNTPKTSLDMQKVTLELRRPKLREPK